MLIVFCVSLTFYFVSQYQIKKLLCYRDSKKMPLVTMCAPTFTSVPAHVKSVLAHPNYNLTGTDYTFYLWFELKTSVCTRYFNIFQFRPHLPMLHNKVIIYVKA